MSTRERPTIHFSELAPAAANSPLAVEWEKYRQEVGHLIEEGHEGKWVLIKGEEVGGSMARTVHMDVGPGRIRITSGLDLVREF